VKFRALQWRNASWRKIRSGLNHYRNKSIHHDKAEDSLYHLAIDLFESNSVTENSLNLGPIVSSGHLAAGALPALSEFEFGMIMLNHAFNRWMVRCMAAGGVPDLSPFDVLVLHNVNHRAKPKRLADICLVLNVEDTHVVNYSLKKLEKLKLIKGGKAGKEKIVVVTPAGQQACEKYKAVREALLVQSVLGTGIDPKKLSAFAAELRSLSGHYDQAARAAASL
jgi:predicted MarR family transcription regulator